MDKETLAIAKSIGIDAEIEAPEPTDVYFGEDQALEGLIAQFGEKEGQKAYDRLYDERRPAED